MVSKKEIDEHLKIALKEIGEIKPKFIKNMNAWVFKSSKYPVEYAGDSYEDVTQGYPLYLLEFIKHWLNDNIAPHTEKKTKGRGGQRIGAGRPKNTKKEPTKRISVPEDVANWFERPGAVSHFRQLVAKER